MWPMHSCTDMYMHIPHMYTYLHIHSHLTPQKKNLLVFWTLG